MIEPVSIQADPCKLLKLVSEPLEDYIEIVRTYTSNYRVDDYYIHVGYPSSGQGWLLHITIVQTQIAELLNILLPVLTSINLPFKIIRNKNLLIDLNGGKFGHVKIGKAITVFLDKEEKVVPLLDAIIPVTQRFLGPKVFTDFKLDNILYIRYGSFIPVVAKDSVGNNVSVIMDKQGQTVLDQYNIPPAIPFEVSNPFAPIMGKIERPPKSNFLGKKYFPIRLLKADVKGNVWKGLYLSKYFMPKWCVIKQGRRGMFPDDSGRDARDRIAWQFKVNRDLENFIPTAFIIDYFEDNGEAYIVMEYVNGGKEIIKTIFEKFKNLPWHLQPANVKNAVIDYLLKIISAIQIIHEKGYIHRDITGTNFLESKHGEIKLIDLELIYSFKELLPRPPFGLGTHGFMSPEQESRSEPRFEDDSYSIGALMIMILTGGLFPNYIIEKDYENVKRKLSFLIRDAYLEDLILKCISINPGDRPNVRGIFSEVTNYKILIPSLPKPDRVFCEVNRKLLEELISNSLHTLGGTKMSHGGLWYSSIENEYGPEIYPLRKKHFFPGIYRGIGGVIWLLSKLKTYGVDILEVTDNLVKGISFIEKEMFSGLANIEPSFYYGRAGLAVVLSTAIDSGIINEGSQHRELIANCFAKDAYSLDVIYGIAGQGLAALQCKNYLQKEAMNELLEHYTNILVSAQRDDGSWATIMNEENKIEKKTGFGYGVAGILYFLLTYGSLFHKAKIIDSAKKGLNYLLKSMRKVKGKYEWFNSDYDKRVCTWWCNGAPGIILSFLKAFEVTNNTLYLDTVSKCLNSIPKYLIYQDLSQCHGLSGLGEIYLEAYRVTKDAEWKQRADWIANLILHLNIEESVTETFWMVEKQDFPTADFMIGNTGVIHFLVRYKLGGSFSFPLL